MTTHPSRTDRASNAESTLQIWGGLECTINRVGDRWSNQADRSGHDKRGVSDLQLFESLGIPMIRYPVLWEAIAPDALDDTHFEVSDEKLGFMKESALEPIVGLLHHGSGPCYTSLVDDDFAEKLGEYAALVAAQYPWVTYYTPVNEPLTTARFSGLYGAWFPHGHDDVTFARALYNEVRGTVLAMQAIRKVNPDAQLVATDDLGRALGTERTKAAVDFQNERRWLSFDLLLGKVTPQHPMHDYLTTSGGITLEELDWLVQNPCPPAIIGVNHYVHSNRFLDHELDWYPPDRISESDGVKLVDVPAVESARTHNPLVQDVLRDVWERYVDIPFAVTEVHVDGDPDTQLQWLWEVWSAAESLRREGAPVVAVTAWSLLGTYDWNTLCTTAPGEPAYYEPGVFDVSSGEPRSTELTEMVQALAAHGVYQHPALHRPGYWHQDIRLKYGVRAPADNPQK